MAITVEEIEIIVRAKVEEAMKDIRKIIPQIKQAVAQTVEPTKQIVNNTKEITKSASFNKAVQSINNYKKSIQNTSAQQEYLLSQIEEIEYKLKRADLNYDVGDTLKLESQLEKLKNQYNKLVDSAKNANEETKKVSNNNKVFRHGINTIKKYALALFSIRGVYALISKASSAYLSMDTKLSNHIQSNWRALGAMFAPLLEMITNLMAKAIAYINAFVKALTGIDFIARANAKALSSQAKAQKSLSNSGADFDEVSNIQKDTDTGTNTDSGLIDLPEVDTTKVEQFANKLKEIWEWIKENKQLIIELGVIIGSVFATVKILEFLNKIKDIKKLLAGLASTGGLQLFAGIALIISGIVVLVQNIMDFIQNPTWQSFFGIIKGIALVVAGIATALGGWVVALVAIGVAIVSHIIQNWDKVKEILGNVGNWIYENIIAPVGEFFVGMWDNIVEGAKMALEGIKKVFSRVAEFFGDIFSKAWENVKKVFSTGRKNI